MTTKVRKIRQAKKLTQEALAEKSGVSVRTVQRMEAGSVTPSQESLEAVAEVLGVSTDELSMISEMPEAMKAALRKIHEGMSDLAAHVYDNPGDFDRFGFSRGTYVFQPRDLEPHVHGLICSEALPFHNAHYMDVREIRPEYGPNPDGSDEPYIRRLCTGPTVSAVIDVSPWRPNLWRATKDFTLRNDQWEQRKGNPFLKGTVEQVEVKRGDRIELVAGDHFGFMWEHRWTYKIVRLDDCDVWAEFDETKLPVVPILDQKRAPYRVPKALKPNTSEDPSSKAF